MLDAISVAVSKTNLTNSVSTVAGQASSAATAAVTNARDTITTSATSTIANARAAATAAAASATTAVTATVASIKSKLPVVPDPTLIKKQVEAEAQLKITQAKETALNAKEKAVAAAKSAAAGAAASATAAATSAITKLVPKLPAVDPKLVAGLAAAKQIKDLAKQRKAESLQNLVKNKDAFKFPLTPSAITAQLPKIPPLPLQAGASLPERSVPEFDKFQLPIRLPS